MIQSAEKSLQDIYNRLGVYLTEWQIDAAAGLPVQAPSAFVFDYLRQTGGGDATDLAVDGTTPIAFNYIVPAGGAVLYRLNFAVLGAAGEDIDGFFAIAELTNGLTVQILDSADDVLENFETDTVPIKAHSDLGALAGVDVVSDATANRSRFSVRWTLDRAGRAPLLDAGSKLRVTVRDDLSSLLRMRVMVQGYVAT